MKTVQTLINDIRNEYQELNKKITNLEYFMTTEDFCNISPEQRALLERQHGAMSRYRDILVRRAYQLNIENPCRKEKRDPCSDCENNNGGECESRVCPNKEHE